MSINSIPDGWRLMSVADFTAEHKQGFYTKDTYGSEGVLLARITDLGNPRVNFETMPRLPVSDKDYEAFKVLKGDFLFARSGAIGRYGIVDIDPPKTVFASYLIRFRFSDEVDSYFIGQVYESALTQSQIKAISQGNANININAENIKKLKMLIPPLPEQKRVTGTLSLVDKKIDLIEQKVSETQQLKKGLMQKLFTEGVGEVDEVGKWQSHTKFKSFPFGKVPYSWGVYRIDDLTAQTISYGIVQTGEQLETGVPCIRVVDLARKQLDPDQMIKTSKKIHNANKKTVLETNDVVLALRGDIGKVVSITNNLSGANLTRGLALIRAGGKITPNYLLWVIRSGFAKKQLLKKVNGSALKEIPLKGLRDVLIPLPPHEEQQKIAEILTKVDEKIDLLNQQKAEAQQLKKGLMQKLLTGEWRVPLDDQAA